MAEIHTKLTNGHTKHPPEPQPVSPEDMMSLEQAREEIAYALGLEAYLWGFPLYTYCNALTDWLKSETVGLNTLRAPPRIPSALDGSVEATDVVLEARAAFDVSHEPVVVHVPHLDSARWYLVQIGDTFDEVIANVGGTKGAQPGDYVIVGPDFAGRVPADMTPLPSRTSMGLVVVRIFVAGQADLPAAARAQAAFHVMPVSTYLRDGLGHPPPRPAPVREPALRGPANTLFFEILGHALQRYLPGTAAADSLVAAFGSIGLRVGTGFDWRDLDPTILRGLARAAATGTQIVDQEWEAVGERTNGWRYDLAGGRTGHDFAVRAAFARHAPGSELAAEVMRASARVDSVEEALSGEHRYVLDFPAGQLPPVAAFWNLALYGDDRRFTDNELRRYTIGSTTPGLRFGPDGSLRIRIQHERPDDAANWLPAPSGSFNLMMRFYGPESSLLDGSYRLAAVRRSV